ncbi:MAG TPA: enoyl-CoA hydratase-related protein [Pyrinomonadaceae bacterium]|nr:enoyl-CoA hydratase-related protein [Pyrinomonadaceae bacterium]
MIKISQNEFIETFRPQSAADLADFFRQIQKDKTRVVVLIIENSLEIEASFWKTPENSEIPVILALKSSAVAGFVDSCHLCLASESAKIGELSAAEALKSGLINKITSSDRVEPEAFALAEKISRLAPPAIRACLKAVREGSKLPLEEGLQIESELFAQIFSTADMREGTRAFLEKRKPVFSGK